MRKFDPGKVPIPKDFVSPPESLSILEIGSGVGTFALSLAKSRPESTIWAIEKTSEKARKFLNNYIDMGSPKNLTPIQGNAINWVVHGIKESTLEEIYILFPNPNPKNKSERWACMPFMGFLISRLKPGGTLTMATNIDWYAEELESQLLTHWNLTLKEKNDYSSHPPRTLFEKKYRASNQTIHNFTFQK